VRILHVFDHSLPLHSGYAFRSAAILREQHRLGWTTAQVTGPKHPCAQREETVDGCRYVRTPHTHATLAKMPIVNQLDVIRALRRQLTRVAAEFNPQIIHAHSPCLNGLAAAAVARHRGVPFVYEMRASWEDAAVSHGSTAEGSLRYRLSRALETHVVRSAAAVTTICEGLRQDILLRGVAADRVTVIPNAVDTDHFNAAARPDPALKARFCAPDARIVGFLGSYYAYEGLDLLLRAVPALRAACPDIHVLLAGGGPEEDRLQALADSLGIGSSVSFAGRIPQAEIPSYYAIADILVYPRRNNRLTDLVTPLKPLEAMAQGRIVAASDVGGHRELISDRQTGFLFRPDDPQAIADTIIAAFANRDLDAIKGRARRYVTENRTWARVVAGYRPVYEGLVATRSARVVGAEARR
jgi:PEP-CTERM/exosortase A-associated glycosyltransferase